MREKKLPSAVSEYISLGYDFEMDSNRSNTIVSVNSTIIVDCVEQFSML